MGIILTSTGLPLLTAAGLIAARPALAGGGPEPQPEPEPGPEPGPAGLAFGTLTLANAGGMPKPARATRITGGTARGYTIADGHVVPSANGSGTSGTIVFDDGTSWTVTALPNEYSVRTVTEMQAVNALGATTLAGKTMRLRPGTYDVVQTNWLSNRSFSSTFTIASHDTDAFPGIGQASHSRVKIIAHRDGIADNYSGMTRITFDGICIEGRYDRNDATSRQYVLDGSGGSLTDVIFENCWLKGDDEVLGGGDTFDGCIGRFNSGFKGSIGLAVRHCRVSDIYRGFNINNNGRKEISNTQIDHCGLDGGTVGWAGEFKFDDNVVFAPASDREFVYWGNKNSQAKASRDSAVTGMTDGKQALFHIYTDECKDNVLNVIFALQGLNGTSYAQLEKTAANRYRFWAKDSGGTTRIDMTSSLVPSSKYRYNILISINNNSGQTNKMFVWEGAPKQGGTPRTGTVTQAGTGHNLHWNAGGYSLAANNVGTSGTNNMAGSIGRLLIHPGISPNPTDPAVQKVYFNSSIGSGPTVRDHATYGKPVLDLSPSLAEIRASSYSGSVIPNFGSGEGPIMRTSATTVEVGHADGLQGITNQASAGGVDVGPWSIQRNLYFGHDTDGEIGANGGQGFFFEDIFSGWYYYDMQFRNNLLVGAAGHGVSIYNPLNVNVWHNSVITPPSLKPETQGLWYKIRMESHAPKVSGEYKYGGGARGITGNTCSARSNLTHGLPINFDKSPDVHPAVCDNLLLPTDTSFDPGDYFSGMNGDGTGFTWSSLTSLAAVKTMFATHPSLNPTGAVKKGWDAYWNLPSPWEGTCDPLSGGIPSRSGAGESALRIPAKVSAGGIAVHTGSAANVEQQLCTSSGTAISGWLTDPIHLKAGQAFKLRRTSGTGTVKVYYGNHTDTWTVS